MDGRPAPVRTLLDAGAGLLAGRRLLAGVVANLDATLVGVANLPRTGGVLLVGNHTLLGTDSLGLTALLMLETGRIPRFLADRNVLRLPGLGRALRAVGAVAGERALAVSLLAGGSAVIVYPGGVDDSFKLSSDAYRLMWGQRAGFARVAMAAGVPIVPVAATGIDELYEVRTKERFLGRRLLGSTRYDLPLPRNLRPRKVPLRYHLLPSVNTEGDPEDPGALERVRAATFDAIEGVLRPYRDSLVLREGPSTSPGGAGA
jgi:1-acyl-sn-glycerol-3-phosphate acyltransferase